MANSVPILATNPDQPRTEIEGLPALPGDGKGGITLAQAAETRPELQDGDGNPLTGAALKKAAESFADAVGVQVTTVSESKAEKLPQINGAAADRPPAADVAASNYEQLHGPLEADEPGTPEDPADLDTTDKSPAAAGDSKE